MFCADINELFLLLMFGFLCRRSELFYGFFPIAVINSKYHLFMKSIDIRASIQFVYLFYSISIMRSGEFFVHSNFT